MTDVGRSPCCGDGKHQTQFREAEDDTENHPDNCCCIPSPVIHAVAKISPQLGILQEKHQQQQQQDI